MGTTTNNAGALTPTTTPFSNIALAFSGGGFRAASFALGTLSYLESVRDISNTPLLNKVTYISSASGGTITNAMYALHSAEGKSFEEFYRNIHGEISGVKLLNNVFRILNDDSIWRAQPTKRRNLINAFALAYDSSLFGHKELGALYSDNPVTHLDEVCFNTTDFYRGLLFRQAVKLKPDVNEPGFLYGNYITNLDHKAAAKLKIADTLAASSCFPAGFEPIIFPGDFNYDKDNTVNKSLTIQLQEVNYKELFLLYGEDRVKKVLATIPPPHTASTIAKAFESEEILPGFQFGLMDGGITDNQGIESLMRANERRVKKETKFKEFDLMLINDVGSHYMDPYQLPKTKNNHTGLSSISLRTVMWICRILILASVAWLGYYFCQDEVTTLKSIITVVSGIVLALSTIILTTLLLVRSKIKSVLPDGKEASAKEYGGLGSNFSGLIVKLFFNFFGSTPIPIIGRMLQERFKSVLTLNNDVFLKRIRQLLYMQFYADGKRSYRLKSNHVYDLTFTNDIIRNQNDSMVLKPSERIQKVAQEAFEMGTTLWFDENNEKQHTLASLIACGQFTTCYNLLDYIHEMKYPKDGSTPYFDQLDTQEQKKINDLEDKLNNDYMNFKDDPYMLYNQLGKEYKLPEFKACSADTIPFPKEFNGLRQ